MFLAYKAITKRPKEFFMNFWRQINDSSLDSSSTVGQDLKSNVKENQSDILDKIERISLISCKSLKRKESPVGSEQLDGYDIFFNMVTDLNYAAITEVFERIIMSTFLLNCMEATGYFASGVNENGSSSGSYETGPKIEDRVILASLIFQAYSVILSNNHSVAEEFQGPNPTGLQGKILLGAKKLRQLPKAGSLSALLFCQNLYPICH